MDSEIPSDPPPMPPSRWDPRRWGLRQWVLAGAGIVGVVLLFALPRVIQVLALLVTVIGIIVLARDRRRSTVTLRQPAALVTASAGGLFILATLLGSAPAPVAPSSTETALGLLSDSSETVQEPEPEPSPTVVEQRTTETIPFEETTIEDPGLPRGQTALTTSGQNGQRVRVYHVTLLDGKEIDRVLVSDTVTVQPIAQVTSIGTHDAPAPAAPDASGCDPNYADACVPIASDVDCAGGGGNGPVYFDGVARVIGVDIYDLDRDGDGFACEP